MNDLQKLYDTVYKSLKEHGALPSQSSVIRIGDRAMVETIIDEFICQLMGMNYMVVPVPEMTLEEAEALEKRASTGITHCPNCEGAMGTGKFDTCSQCTGEEV